MTADDYVSAQTLHMRKWRRRQHAMLGLCVLAGLPLAFTDWRMAGLILIAAGVGGTLGALVLHLRNLPRAWKKHYEQQKSLQKRFDYSWDAEGLHVSTPLARAFRPWSHFAARNEDDRSILLYHSDVMFELIPKHWFADAAALEAFRAQVSCLPLAARK